MDINNLVGMEVVHKTLGKGKILYITESVIVVDFAEQAKRLKMEFPRAFEQYLSIDDVELMTELRDMINSMENEKMVQTEIVQLKREEAIAKEHVEIIEKSKIMSIGTKNGGNRPCIAVKFTYCDGGKSENGIGFCGICSFENMTRNVEANKSWCASEDSSCFQYYYDEIDEAELNDYWDSEEYGTYPCTDSTIFRDWIARVETKVVSAQRGHLCLLTTRLPESKEKERVIFGFFLVDKVESYYRDDDREYSEIYAQDKYRVQFTKEEAEKMKFWQYHKNPNSPNSLVWGSGQTRYFDDLEAIKIIEAAIDVKENVNDKKQIESLLTYYKKINNLL